MVSRILEQQRPSRDLLVPDRPLKNSSPPRFPKVSPRKDGAPARGTGRRLTEALVKSTPLLASLSKWGVFATSLIPPAPRSWHKWMPACPSHRRRQKARSAAWLKKQRAREAKAERRKTRVSFFCDRLRWTLRQALELCLSKITRPFTRTRTGCNAFA